MSYGNQGSFQQQKDDFCFYYKDDVLNKVVIMCVLNAGTKPDV